MIHVLSNPQWPPSDLLHWPGLTVVLGAVIHSLSYFGEQKPNKPVRNYSSFTEICDSGQSL